MAIATAQNCFQAVVSVPETTSSGTECIEVSMAGATKQVLPYRLAVDECLRYAFLFLVQVEKIFSW